MSTLPPSSLTPDEQLREFRRQIDAIDEQVTQLLLDRCGVVKQVGALKSIHWPSPCYIRPAREGQMHEAIAERFVGTDIHPTAAVTIWRQLIGMSTSLESPLTVVNLTAHPHHPWLAREYFGATAGLRQETSLADALDAMKAGQANILLLPAPGTDGGDWWQDAKIFGTYGLSLFATLPALNQKLPNGDAPALAFASVPMEPSGHDVSYFVLVTSGDDVEAARLQALLPAQVISANATHHLLMAEGFLTAESPQLNELKHALVSAFVSLTYLGTHPRAVTL